MILCLWSDGSLSFPLASVPSSLQNTRLQSQRPRSVVLLTACPQASFGWQEVVGRKCSSKQTSPESLLKHSEFLLFFHTDVQQETVPCCCIGTVLSEWVLYGVADYLFSSSSDARIVSFAWMFRSLCWEKGVETDRNLTFRRFPPLPNSGTSHRGLRTDNRPLRPTTAPFVSLCFLANLYPFSTEQSECRVRNWDIWGFDARRLDFLDKPKLPAVVCWTLFHLIPEAISPED